jgi:hypothetical protein
MCRAFTWIAVLAVTSAAGQFVHAQESKKGGRAGASYRTLTGKVSDLDPGDKMVTIEAASEAVAKPKTKAKEGGGQSWLLSVGRQTLLLRAGKNNQFATLEFADLQKGDSVQAVASLQADSSDRSHTAWWLIVYPAGTTPPSR